MEWTKHVLEVYLIAILVLIHLSLLLCKENSCIFDASPVYEMIPPNLAKFIVKMLNFVPISLQNIQTVAHFLLLGDLILIISFGLRVFGSLLFSIIKIVLMSLVISFIIYLITSGNSTQVF